VINAPFRVPFTTALLAKVSHQREIEENSGKTAILAASRAESWSVPESRQKFTDHASHGMSSST
jgi:hypothetical protein